jgi:type I restriction enzyme S subunit
MSVFPNRHSHEGTSSSNAVAPVRHSLESGNPQDLITDHLDIWTAAIKTKSSAGRGSSKKLELVGVKKLRELILELAVRGKLVPQDPNDESASELLKKIEAEKARLVKEGKIKKQKPLLPIAELEIPFLLPNGWEWCRFGECVSLRSGTSFGIEREQDLGEIPYCKVGDMNMVENICNLTTSSRFINPTKKDLNQLIPIDSIAFPKRGGAIATNKKRFIHKELFVDLNIMAATPYKPISLNYVMTWLNGIDLASLNTGTSVPQINNKDIEPLLFPIPPVEEQHRIVDKVDELMALCDQLEAQTENSIQAHQLLVETLLATLTNAKDADELNENWQTISQHFDVLFTTQASIVQLKQTILQLAVMGKLVKQDPKDEPACKLLERIATQKQQLINDGTIKKQTPLPPIAENEKPFELPQGWEFERFGNLTSRLGSGSTPRGGQSAYVEKGVIFLRSQNIWNDGLKLDDTAYITDETNEKMNNTQVFPGDVLLNITGASLGRSTIFPEHLKIANVSQHVTIIRLIEESMGLFVHLGILSPLVQRLVWGRQVGMAIEGLSKKVLELFEFPVPPLAEQHRIVAKVDELMILCDSLKANLNQAQTTQLHLTDAIVEQAL